MANDTIHVLNKHLALKQPRDGFKTSIDAVLLAAACPVKAGQSVLDMGAGVGTAGLCVLTRMADVSLTGIEIQECHVAMAQENAALNGLQERATFIHSDIREFSGTAHHHVICNPPYLTAGTYVEADSSAKALAMGGEVNLSDWASAAFNHISGQGSFTIVHRADMIDQIIQALGKRFGGIEIIPLWPRAGEVAKRVIIRCWKHKKSRATIHPGLVLHEGEGYSAATEKILRDGAALL